VFVPNVVCMASSMKNNFRVSFEVSEFVKHRGEQISSNYFCMVAPNIWGSSVCSVLHVTFQTPRIFRWCLYFL